MARRFHVVNSDVTDLGEQLAELHIDTLASDLDGETADHYRRALEHYEQAKDKVRTSATVEDILEVEQLLADARYHRAGVLALEAGEPLPARREPCFFDPRHGPSMSDVQWTPPAGVARTLGSCPRGRWDRGRDGPPSQLRRRTVGLSQSEESRRGPPESVSRRKRWTGRCRRLPRLRPWLPPDRIAQ